MKGKLVRDNIPEIIFKNDGVRAKTKILNLSAYKKELYVKLQEEVREVLEAKTPQALAAELADVEEVIDAILALTKLSRKKITALQVQKRKDRGAFKKRIYLIE